MESIDPQIQQIQDQIEAYQNMARQEYNVPTEQSLPIASRPDIAFRPNCAQLEAVWEAEQTAWVWEGETLYKTTGAVTATNEMLLNLQSAGICSASPHAQNVSLVMTDEVLIKLQLLKSEADVTYPQGVQQVVSQLISKTAVIFPLNNSWPLFVRAPIPMIGIAIGLIVLGRFEKRKNSK